MYRAALWALVVVVLASSLATLPGALGASPNYTLTGYVHQPGGAPVPNGVQVDLVSRATGVVYTTTTFGGGGEFQFTTVTTSGAIAPGYWGVSVPAQGNASFSLCSPCAALPQQQNPTFAYQSATNLTSTLYPVIVPNVQVLAYGATLKGTVSDQAGGSAAGATVHLLDPIYNGLVLANTTTNATGVYSLKVPLGSWVLQTTQSGPLPNYSNETAVTVSTSTATANPVIQTYLVSGSMQTTSGAPIPSTGNATLFDGTNGYIYTRPTAVGGYYALGTYPAGFTSGSQSFDVILASVGYSTGYFPIVVSSSSPILQNFQLPALQPGQQGVYQTTLDFSGINPATGSGSLAVSTAASLGNDTVFANLPNASVGQMWAQLGLDFGHSLSFSSTSLPALYQFLNQSGPFFPAVQAGTSVNGTQFVGPSSSENLTSYSSTCSGSCGLASTATLSLGWSESYALNGTLFKNSSSYTIAFNFQHPVSADAYDYSVVLPAGYVLKADTPAPANTQLVPAGAGGTWTKFTLVSQPGPSAEGSAQFTIVKYSALTAIVNASVTNFAFSSHNVLNSTRGNYTVEVGVGQNVTFSALNSLYPSGTNGTRFNWTFGDKSSASTSVGTTYHIYSAASGATPYSGTLNVTSSGGLTDQTTFHVWVGNGPVTAGLANNATANESKTVSSTTYLFVNWGTTLHFNATTSTAAINGSAAPVAGIISVASYRLSAWGGFSTIIGNYSIAQGSAYLAFSNLSYQFLGAGKYLSHGVVAGNTVAFAGWQYNLTLTVWSATGQSASTTLVILVNDTEKPVSAFQILNSASKPITGTGLVAGSNASAEVLLNGANASDPHNGSITHYYWLVTNGGNSSIHFGFNSTTVRPYPAVWLSAAVHAYTVNLTVTDANGNTGYATQSLTVSVNSTITPVMAANNLTAPATLTDGSSYTIWVNVTTGGGTKAVATSVTVAFYFTTPSGTSRTYIAGSPGSVKFYNYTSAGVVNSQPMAVGTLSSLAYNVTVRAVITWTPAVSGNYVLYANVSAANQFTGSTSTSNVVSTSITINPNPTTQTLEYVAIGVAVVVVLGLIIVYYRRRSRRGSAPKPSSGRGGLERGSKRSEDEEDEE